MIILDDLRDSENNNVQASKSSVRTWFDEPWIRRKNKDGSESEPLIMFLKFPEVV